MADIVLSTYGAHAPETTGPRPPSAYAKWDEEQHPRDVSGRFSPIGEAGVVPHGEDDVGRYIDHEAHGRVYTPESRDDYDRIPNGSKWIDIDSSDISEKATRVTRNTGPSSEARNTLGDMRDRGVPGYEQWLESEGIEDDDEYLSEFLESEHSIKVRDDGRVEFDHLSPNVGHVIGHHPVVLNHHTSDALEDSIREKGLLRRGHDGVPNTNPHMNTGAGVYLTTEYSGPAVRGYHDVATGAHGGSPRTFEVEAYLDELQPDPDDDDLSVGSRQFVVPSVEPGRILNGRRRKEGRPILCNNPARTNSEICARSRDISPDIYARTPGETMVKNGVTYVLNENHRWTRPRTSEQTSARTNSSPQLVRARDTNEIVPTQKGDTKTTESAQVVDTKGAQKTDRGKSFVSWFGNSKVVDEHGKPAVVYHGTARPDRIGDEFRSERATAGPSAYFTNDPQVASGYAEGKPDTSHEVENEAELFDVGGLGDLDTAWTNMSALQRVKIRESLTTIGYDEDDEFVLNSDDPAIPEHVIRQAAANAGGNYLRGGYEALVNSGFMFQEENKFAELMSQASGLPIRWEDPNAAYSAIFPAYLSIQNPLDTSRVPDDVVAAIESASKAAPQPEYQIGVDSWDKRASDPEEWMAYFRDGIEQGHTNAWTTVPDWVTQTLKGLGYDGVKDAGGKYTPHEHEVWIPFEPTQIKSATANRGGYSPGSAKITESRDDEPLRYDEEFEKKHPRSESGEFAAIPADEAAELVHKIRSGDERSKNQGEEPGYTPIETGPLHLTQLPTNFFDQYEDPDYGTETGFLEATTDQDRVKSYAGQEIDTPIYVPTNRRGKHTLSDGGHRLMAARMRGDTHIPALVSPELHEQLQGQQKYSGAAELSMQPGETKTENGKTYVLNQNHRWELDEPFSLKSEPAVRPKKAEFENQTGQQGKLFQTSGLAGQMDLFKQPGTPDDLVQKTPASGEQSDDHTPPQEERRDYFSERTVHDDHYDGPRWSYGRSKPPGSHPSGEIVGADKGHSEFNHGTVDYPFQLEPSELIKFGLTPVYRPGQQIIFPENSIVGIDGGIELTYLGEHDGQSFLEWSDRTGGDDPKNPQVGKPDTWKYATRMPAESLHGFINDMQGRVAIEPSQHPEIEAVRRGKGELLGKGHESVAWRVGDKVVKKGTTAPYHPLGAPGAGGQEHRTPGEAIDSVAQDYANSRRMLKEGVPGIQSMKVSVEKGAQGAPDAAFAIVDHLDTETRMNRDQLDQVRDSIRKMHDAGWTLNDQLQVGIGIDGKAYHFDIGFASKDGGKYGKDDDVDSLKRLYKEHGEEFLPWGKKAQDDLDTFEMIASDFGRDASAEFGEQHLKIVARDANLARKGLNADDPRQMDGRNQQFVEFTQKAGLDPADYLEPNEMPGPRVQKTLFRKFRLHKIRYEKQESGWMSLGGASIFVGDDGKIEMGCPGLEGETLSSLDDNPAARAARQKQAEDAGWESAETKDARQTHGEAKEQLGDQYVVLARLGDKVYAFGGDAALLNDLTQVGDGESANFDTDDLDHHMERLVSKGHRVAIVDRLEDGSPTLDSELDAEAQEIFRDSREEYVEIPEGIDSFEWGDYDPELSEEPHDLFDDDSTTQAETDRPTAEPAAGPRETDSGKWEERLRSLEERRPDLRAPAAADRTAAETESPGEIAQIPNQPSPGDSKASTEGMLSTQEVIGQLVDILKSDLPDLGDEIDSAAAAAAQSGEPFELYDTINSGPRRPSREARHKMAGLLAEHESNAVNERDRQAGPHDDPRSTGEGVATAEAGVDDTRKIPPGSGAAAVGPGTDEVESRDPLFERGMSAVAHIDVAPNSVKGLLRSLHGMRAVKQKGFGQTNQLSPDYAREMYDYLRENPEADQFGQTHDLSGTLGHGAIGYESPGGNVVLIPPKFKTDDWDVRYSLPADVSPPPTPPIDTAKTAERYPEKPEKPKKRAPRPVNPETRLGSAIVNAVGNDPEEQQKLKEVIDEVWKDKKREAADRANAINNVIGQHVPDTERSGFLNSLKAYARQGRDYDAFAKNSPYGKTFDEMAQTAARYHPEILMHDEGEAFVEDPENALWNTLAQRLTGTMSGPARHSDEVVEAALERLEAEERMGAEYERRMAEDPEFARWQEELASREFSRDDSPQRYRKWRSKQLERWRKYSQQLTFNWDETKHPRGEGGKFATSPTVDRAPKTKTKTATKTATHNAPTATSESSNEELVDRIQSGDTGAQSLILSQNAGLIKNIAGRFSRNETDRNDLEQEASMAILRAAEKYDASKGVPFAKYAAYWIQSRVSRAAKKLRGFQSEREDEQFNPVDESMRTSNELAGEDELIGRIQSVLPELPDRDREILSMRFEDGMSFTQIADHYGVSKQAIQKAAAKSLDALRKQLGASKYAKDAERVVQYANQLMLEFPEHQPGDTKTEGDTTYVFNQNHRWERRDVDMPAQGEVSTTFDVSDSEPATTTPAARLPVPGAVKPFGEHPGDMSPDDFHKSSEIRNAAFSNYGPNSESSRHKPQDIRYNAKVGDWRIDDDFKGNHGRFLEQLVEVDPSELLLPEGDYSDDSTKWNNPEGRKDDSKRYADWMKEGKSPPPIEVIQTEQGSLRVSDGHRRAGAAKRLGMPIQAWVSYSVPVPGMETPDGKPIYTGLTDELAKHYAGAAEPREPIADAQTTESASSPEDDWKENGVRAKAFKDWFGDWEKDPGNASKVVDPKTGEPAPVYHGTPRGGFDRFDPSSVAGTSMMAQQGPGFYFTDKDNASQYLGRDSQGNPSKRQSKDSQLYEVYLDIKKPLQVTESSSSVPLGKIKNVLLDGDNEWFFSDWIPFQLSDTEVDGETATKDQISLLPKGKKVDLYLRYLTSGRRQDIEVLSNIHRAYKDKRSLLGNMKKHTGHDGVQFSDRYGDIFVAWDPTQIKSTDNRGTFNPSDERMKYAATEQPHQPGNTKTENGVSYVLNDNHRWERQDRNTPAQVEKQTATTKKRQSSQRPTARQLGRAAGRLMSFLNAAPTFAANVAKEAGASDNVAKMAYAAATVADWASPGIPAGSTAVIALSTVKNPRAVYNAASKAYVSMRKKLKDKMSADSSSEAVLKKAVSSGDPEHWMIAYLAATDNGASSAQASVFADEYARESVAA